MKKLIIFGAGGFVAALVVSTLIRVLIAPPSPPVVAPEAESAGAHETAAQGAHPGGTESGAEKAVEGTGPEVAVKASEGAKTSEETNGPDSASKPEASPEGDAEVATQGGEPAEPAPPVAQPAVATGAAKPNEGKELKLLAKILTNMKPAEAAKVLKDLPDDQVQRLIVAMGARSAATVLAQLPPERAAALSRRMLEEPMSETP